MSVGQIPDVLGQVGHPRPAGDGSAQPAESVDRAFTQAHARELRWWAGCIGEAKVEGFHLSVRPAQSRLEVPPLSRQDDDLHHGDEEQGDRRQDCKVTRRCFHDQLPGTMRGFRRGAPRWIATIGPVVKTQRPAFAEESRP